MAVPPVWSSRLAALNVTVASAWETLYTVPSGRVAIVKTVTVQNNSAGSMDLYIGLNANQAMHKIVGLATISTAEWDTWVVLEDGDTLDAFLSAQPAAFTVHGQLLTLP